jgi:anti-sigma factor RsiW
MTSNFDEYDNSNAPSPSGGQDVNHGSTHFSSERLDSLTKRDRFELLSAYLDGEVTAAERRQVEQALASDLATQQLYARLLKLRQGLRSLPVPMPEHRAEEVARQVVTRLERKPQRRALVWGGVAIAALFVSALVSGLPRMNYGSSVATNAKNDTSTEATRHDEGLMIALDRPVIEIPKPAVATPNQPNQSTNIQ